MRADKQLSLCIAVSFSDALINVLTRFAPSSQLISFPRRHFIFPYVHVCRLPPPPSRPMADNESRHPATTILRPSSMPRRER